MSNDRQAADRKIKEILDKYEEQISTSVWRVQGNAVIHHKTLERIAVKIGIRYRAPLIIRSEADEAVILVTGVLGDHEEWSIGEAKIGLNYRVSGNQAGYPYAMAEKRAKDRVILKLIGLHGMLYSEEEADDFKDGAHTDDEPRQEEPARTQFSARHPDPDPEIDPVPSQITAKIDAAKSVNAVTDLMLNQETQAVLNDLPPGERDKVRAYAKARLHALGWPVKKAA